MKAIMSGDLQVFKSSECSPHDRFHNFTVKVLAP